MPNSAQLPTSANSSDHTGAFTESHRRCSEALDVLLAGTQKSKLEPDKLMNARWDLSRAILVRRALWGKVFRQLISQLSSEEAKALRALDLADQALLRRCASHNATWSSSGIEANWEGYCEAAKVLATLIKAALREEEGILLPILKRAGR